MLKDTIITGDCLEVMKTIPDNSIDAIITDPPYGIDKGKIDGDNTTNTFLNIIPELFRVLKDGCFFATFVSIEKLPEILNYSLYCGFFYEWQYICYINNGMVRGRMGFSCYMSVLIFSKGNAKIKSQLRDVCELSAEIKKMNSRQHPYQKDVSFIQPLIKSICAPGDLILDPFCGSGSVPVAAKLHNCNYIGIELNQEYSAIAEMRLKQQSEQRGIFEY